jgi:hypothetical protein
MVWACIADRPHVRRKEAIGPSRGLHSSEIESHLVHYIKLLIFEALGRSSSEVVGLLLLEVAAS